MACHSWIFIFKKKSGSRFYQNPIFPKTPHDTSQHEKTTAGVTHTRRSCFKHPAHFIYKLEMCFAFQPSSLFHAHSSLTFPWASTYNVLLCCSKFPSEGQVMLYYTTGGGLPAITHHFWLCSCITRRENYRKFVSQKEKPQKAPPDNQENRNSEKWINF